MSAKSSPSTTQRRLAGDQRVQAVTSTSVERLLAEIADKRQSERQRLGIRSRRQRRRGDERNRTSTTTEEAAIAKKFAEHFYVETDDALTGNDVYDDNDEAASAYWWMDMFLRYFVFDEDYIKTKIVADSDDLLFFVRRHRRDKKDRQFSQPRVTYETRAYRKQYKHQQSTLLPIGDPAVLWRQTVCLNAIIHKLRYTLTVAVCSRIPRGNTGAGSDYSFDVLDEYGFYNIPDVDCDLQLLSRHVHTVYASTSGRRMDAAKGPKERPVYPAICWAVDDFAEAFSTVVVRPGQTVCVELTASWPNTTVDDDYGDKCNVDDVENYEHNDDDFSFFGQIDSASVNVQKKQNQAVLFTGAIPYGAVRAVYECKMSLYHEAERQRRKQRREQQKRGCGKKSSLGATLSASLTALFTGGKDSTDAFCGDYGYDYGTASSADAERVEYVTVRGYRPQYNDWEDDESSSGVENDLDFYDSDFDEASANSNSNNGTKGLAQMAVAMAPVQPIEMGNTCNCNEAEGNEYHYQHYGEVYGSNGGLDYNAVKYNDDDDYEYQQNHKMQLEPTSYPSAATASEPGDFYDYGWDYDTGGGSGQQTPQTPYFHYQQQLEKQRRRGKRPRRLSDPCSTSVFDLLEDDGGYRGQHYQHTTGNNSNRSGGDRRMQQNNYQQYQRQLSGYGCGDETPEVMTPGRPNQHPQRAWSESDGLDRCCDGGGWPCGLAQQENQRQITLLPPPPVPYYCAAEASASGFTQYVHKSPRGWWTRTRNRRRKTRKRSKTHALLKQRGSHSSTTLNQRRSASAGNNRNNGSSSNITDDDDEDDNNSIGSASYANSEEDYSNSDDQDSDGEFIGALAAAAAFGHNPDREWMEEEDAGDPMAYWDRYASEDTSVADSAVMTTADDIAVEWTTEIMANDLRHWRPCSNAQLPAELLRVAIQHKNLLNFFDRPSPLQTPVTPNYYQQQQQTFVSSCCQQQRRRRPPPPQFRMQLPELPPPPPALSVAFTAVACPWWSVLEDVLFVFTNTAERQSFSKRMPLLTFD